MSYDAKRDTNRIATVPNAIKINILDPTNIDTYNKNVRIQLSDTQNNPVQISVVIEVAIFEDELLSNLSQLAKLSESSEGIIISGENLSAINIKTDNFGKFTCKLNHLLQGSVYMGCSTTYGSLAIDCTNKKQIIF